MSDTGRFEMSQTRDSVTVHMTSKFTFQNPVNKTWLPTEKSSGRSTTINLPGIYQQQQKYAIFLFVPLTVTSYGYLLLLTQLLDTFLWFWFSQSQWQTDKDVESFIFLKADYLIYSLLYQTKKFIPTILVMSVSYYHTSSQSRQQEYFPFLSTASMFIVDKMVVVPIQVMWFVLTCDMFAGWHHWTYAPLIVLTYTLWLLAAPLFIMMSVRPDMGCSLGAPRLEGPQGPLVMGPPKEKKTPKELNISEQRRFIYFQI